MKGELTPQGGGDTIPLYKESLRVGRREDCDIVLRFANVSAYHCVLSLEEGYWFVKDLNSRNGTKVNGTRVLTRKRLDPGCELAVAKHKYSVNYSPDELGAIGPPPPDEMQENIMRSSLMDRAGLSRRDENLGGRYDVQRDDDGELNRYKQNKRNKWGENYDGEKKA